MIDKDSDLRAAEYVLGTLGAGERRRFDEEMARSPALQDLVGAWEHRLEGLDGRTATEALPEGLWDKIESALDQTAREADKTTLRSGEGVWELLQEGVEKQLLFFDRALGTESFLLRIAPGTRLSAHHHEMAEECLMLEGEMSIGDLHLAAGDYHVAMPGSDHGEIHSEIGALLYIRGELREAAH